MRRLHCACSIFVMCNSLLGKLHMTLPNTYITLVIFIPPDVFGKKSPCTFLQNSL